MRFSTAAAIGLLALCACMPSDANAQTRAEPYRAQGTEPFWSLTIDGQTMRFESAFGRPVSVPQPRVIHGFAGEIYQTRQMNVNVVHTPCSDGMSDRSYRDTVQVTLGGRQYKGCGGAFTVKPQPAPLAGSWRIEAIGGNPAWAPRPATIRFEGDRLSGNTGCNAFSGSYRFERGRLTAGPVASTRRFCAERGANTQESNILGLLGKPLSVSTNRSGKLVLTAPGGATMTLAREGGPRR
ncbi:META domain-containing protein [Sphingomonas sp.]|uniref:META domain-containing protein n=1 Tax=Sphingomonas sp. TaxID=28214 RepID=UPI001B0D86AA|nr:META domain-containing protein [Sphingomonas sp.]MBO9711804.1 META domain-containing protein [Sphingomonas sp.]